MKANDQVPAPQGKVTPGFSLAQGGSANLIAIEVQKWPKSRHGPRNLGNFGFNKEEIS